MITKNVWFGLQTAAVLSIFIWLASVLGAMAGFFPATAYLIAVVGWCYVANLIRSEAVVGKTTLLAILAGLFLVGANALTLFWLLAFIGITTCLIRSAMCYESAIASLMDLSLLALGVALGSWCLTSTGNMALACWTFFLAQAAYVWIPKRPLELFQRKTRGMQQPAKTARRFEEASGIAGEQIAKLTSSQRLQ